MTCRYLAALALAAFAAPAFCAQEVDPLKSDACKAALTVMERAIAQPASRVKAARVAAAREEASVACLGRSQGRATRSGAPETVQAVPAPVIAGPATSPAAAPAVVPPQSALAIQRPTVITICDPAGCWDSEGRRLNNIGPLLMSPSGPCTVQGGVAHCP